MIVFAGPSLPPTLRDRWRDIDWRPPAAANDLFGLIGQRPDKVLLIDGLFEERASVKHKEALLLMASGSRLYGASSMGALRAAELAEYGMRPLGRIAGAYRNGLLVGDDEVALIHGDSRTAWQAASVPMVEVRATLCLAVRRGVIDVSTARTLRARWHGIFFADRDWHSMEEAAEGIVDTATVRTIAGTHVPLKTMDAQFAVDAALHDDRPSPKLEAPPETWFVDQLRDDLNPR